MLNPDAENSFGKYLRTIRKEMDVSQYKLADLTGLSVSHICRLEKGNRWPSGTTLVKLARGLGIDEIELLVLAGYREAQEKDVSGREDEISGGDIDRFTALCLFHERPEIQRQVIEVLKLMVDTARTNTFSD